MSRIDELYSKRDDLETLIDDLGIQISDAEREKDEVDEEINNGDWEDVCPDDVIEDDNRQRAADMNATLADIGGGL